MKFVKLDVNTHDLYKVSKWIYETELEVFRPLIGRNETEAIKNIKTLIKSKSNVFSHENVHVVTDTNENILGILVAFSGNDISFLGELRAYYNVLDIFSFLKFLTKGIAIAALLTTSPGHDEYYLSNIAVDPRFRGQGVGSFVIESAFKIAKARGCKKVLLDVTFRNKGAKRLYERFGFKVNNKNSSKLIWTDKGTYGMEYIL